MDPYVKFGIYAVVGLVVLVLTVGAFFRPIRNSYEDQTPEETDHSQETA